MDLTTFSNCSLAMNSVILLKKKSHFFFFRLESSIFNGKPELRLSGQLFCALKQVFVKGARLNFFFMRGLHFRQDIPV